MGIFDATDTRLLSKAELGQVIRYLRELRQWSQETLAELAETTPRTIQRVEAGSGANLNTLRSLASAFDIQDIDIFNKPMAIPTDEQLQAAREQFEKDYITSKALKIESGRFLAKLAAESVGDYIEPAFELSREQAVIFAELTDYVREYRDCAELYTSTSLLEVFDELQNLLTRLGDQGVTLRYATRQVLQKTSHPQQELQLVGQVLYIVGFSEGEAPDEIALPRKISFW
ncbi:helix-turn-helix domain-containing protein [Pseudomonas putida]|uniref:helix-turn-helix domain-containing protein n=1 Tax=Pseudomonas putida TaxID=303 RepID=UPI0022DD2975|nr:helix-turn-helix transcriptional regulator [Pseudomonas putida]MDY4309441.1 helix-turn-helix transcriptional regulator [Pseudomonas putida]MDY4318836.1 helix-turn-helix transcriptional regulator [Pseudomonas putida]MDY4352221.1 helix-turn-helix transcriptional regulator [Pseudomonas putida]WBM48160.1 helix-turn-helix transcriptional regulator [Pseudomonas putida]